MDRSLVAGPAPFFRLLSCYFFALFFLPWSNAQRDRGKFPRAHNLSTVRGVGKQKAGKLQLL